MISAATSRLGANSTHHPAVAPAYTVTSNPPWSAGRTSAHPTHPTTTGWAGRASLLRILRNLLGGAGRWGIRRFGAAGLGTAGDDHGFLVDYAYQGCSGHATHDHALV